MLLLATSGWDQAGVAATIASFALAVGLLVGHRYRDIRLRRQAPTVEVERKLDSALVEIGKMSAAVTTMSEALTGRSPTPLEPDPPPGLIAVVVHHGKMLKDIEESIDAGKPN